jgi:hypothetical protein
MSKVENIEAQIRGLSKEEVESLRDWIEDYLEDQLEIAPEFAASIERGEADLRAGRVRIKKA